MSIHHLTDSVLSVCLFISPSVFLTVCLSVSVFLSLYLQDKEPRGIIPLENLCVKEVHYPRKPVSNTNMKPSTHQHILYMQTDMCACVYINM